MVETRVAGVDGCPAGWVVVVRDPSGTAPPEGLVVPRLADLVEARPDLAVIAVDMPIGLPDRVSIGGRGPENRIRPHLGARQSSVFSVPSRGAVYAGADLPADQGYRAACTVALATSDPPRKISKQAFFLFPKIRELDALLIADPVLRTRLFEVHPEFAFWRLNGGAPMALPKKIKGSPNPAGLTARADLLVAHGYERAFVTARPPRGVGADDWIDACVNAVIAERILAGTATPHPDPPGADARGIPLAIWA
jgi:predicted RNase H-like nuclease